MPEFRTGYLVNALVFALLGLAIFAVAFAAFDKLTPYQLWKEIIERQNTALAILVGAVVIGMCMIIAAAVH